MIKKVKLFIVAVAVAVCLAILVFTVHFIASKPFRDQIPGLSNAILVSKPVKEQTEIFNSI